jgi:hypothetical protein
MVRQDLVIYFAVLSFLFSTMASAEEVICGSQDYVSSTQPDFECPSPGESEMVPDLHPPASIPVVVGSQTKATWDGALVHRDRPVEVGLRVRAIRRLRWADSLRLAAEYSVSLEHVREVSRIQLEHMSAQRDAYEERWRAAETKAMQSERWWHSPALWIGVGMVIASCLFALSAYGLSAVSN